MEGNKIFGIIYKITTSESDDVYIGSTKQTLNKRFAQHKCSLTRYNSGNYPYMRSFDIVKFPDANITLIYEGLFDTEADLLRLEGQWISKVEHCINSLIPGRTYEEYRMENKQILNDYAKQYYYENRSIVNEKISNIKTNIKIHCENTRSNITTSTKV